MDNIQYVYTVGMDDAEVERRLREAETGVLSLADEGRAYAVPVHSFYRAGRLVFRLTDDGHSEKLAFVETTTEACFVVYGATNGDSWSVLAQGAIRRLPPEAADSYDAEAINRRFGPARIFDEDVADTDVAIYELDVETVTGRRTSAGDSLDAGSRPDADG